MKSQISTGEKELDQTNVFVKHLPGELEDEGLIDLFVPYGEIISAKVMMDYNRGVSLGYGFVRFSAPEEAQEAIQKLSGQRIGSKTLLCKLSNLSPNCVPKEASTNLYIKPLPTTTTEADLLQTFSKFGTIVTAKALIDKVTGECTQIGFVRFEHQEDATAALNAMNGRKLASDLPPLIVRYAETDMQRINRKSRCFGSFQRSPSPVYSPPPPSPTYSFASQVIYGPIQYIPVSIATPHNHFIAYQAQFDPYATFWSPPYEQTISY